MFAAALGPRAVRLGFHPRHVEEIGQGIEPCGTGEASKLSGHFGDVFGENGRIVSRRARLLQWLARRRASHFIGELPGFSRSQGRISTAKKRE